MEFSSTDETYYNKHNDISFVEIARAFVTEDEFFFEAVPFDNVLKLSLGYLLWWIRATKESIVQPVQHEQG